MDIDNFSQCLQYIQATNTTLSLDKLIPVGSALTGAILGFALNHFSTSNKESKKTANKLISCNEDIKDIQNTAKYIALEVCNICDYIANNKTLYSHHLPPSINFIYLDQYFIDIAHQYSENQRNSMKQLIMTLEAINKTFHKLEPHKLTYAYSLALLRLVNQATIVWRLCENIKNNNNNSYSEQEVFDELPATNPQKEWYEKVKDNANNGNSILSLTNA